MFVEVIKQSLMAVRGRWVWQPERPRALVREDGFGFRPPHQPPTFDLKLQSDHHHRDSNHPRGDPSIRFLKRG
jgi:hypothetical protein